MKYLLLYLIILSIALFISNISKKTLGKTLFLSVCSISLILYLFGILSLLSIGYYIITAVGIGLFIYNLYYLYKNKSLLNILKEPGLYFYTIAFLFSTLLAKYNTVTFWDEFSHWALYVKNVYMNDSLWSSNFSSSPNGYPPIVSVFEYFVLKSKNLYDESILYTSMALLVTLSYSSIIDILKNKKFMIIKTCVLSAVLILFPFSFFYQSYKTLYVDILLATASINLIYDYIYDGIDKFNIIKAAIISSFIVLIKEFGLIFVGCFYIFVCVDFLFLRKKQYIEFYKKNIKPNIKKYIVYIAIILLPIIFRVSWNIFMNIFCSIPTQAQNLKIGIPAATTLIIKNFIIKFLKGAISSGNVSCCYSMYYWAILFIIIICLIYSNTKEKEKLKFMTLYTAIIFIFYSLGLVFSYIFLFSEYEGVRLASFERYFSTLLLFVYSAIFIMQLVNLCKNKDNNKIKSFIIILLLFSLLNMSSFVGLLNINKNIKNIEEAKINTDFLDIDELKNMIEKDKKVYFVETGDDGFDYWVTRYIMTPIKIQDTMEWSFGSPCYEDDIWTKTITEQEFKNNISEYDYIYIRRINNDFVNQYGNLFEDSSAINNNTLFAIKRGKDTIKITYLKTLNNIQK